MAEREYIARAAVIAAMLLLCILAGMRLISGWGVLTGAIIVTCAYYLREAGHKCEQLEEQLAQEKERNRTLSERLQQVREQAAAQLEKERITARRKVAARRTAAETAKAELLSHLAHEL